jgi:hypothetical protein
MAGGELRENVFRTALGQPGFDPDASPVSKSGESALIELPWYTHLQATIVFALYLGRLLTVRCRYSLSWTRPRSHILWGR